MPGIIGKEGIQCPLHTLLQHIIPQYIIVYRHKRLPVAVLVLSTYAASYYYHSRYSTAYISLIHGRSLKPCANQIV